MSDSTFDRFRALLAELFMFDQADLDFGIYRIMNARRDEITRFLDNDLLPQVRSELEDVGGAERKRLEAELEEKIRQAREYVADPEKAAPVVAVREKLQATLDPAALEAEIFSDLTNFFRRYYEEGDFISQRRYRPGVYAIPYEGEEVKLHWANADQYYIKTSEHFRDYTFRLPDGRRVHFKLTDADSEANNNQPSNGQQRRFMLCEADPVAEQDRDLLIRFEHGSDPKKRKQAALNESAVQLILTSSAAAPWLSALATPVPTPKKPERTLLEKHLAEYTSRNSFDYFIHKDLGAFLRRELDFFIKNEILHLDDVENETPDRYQRHLAKLKALRRVAHKIIDLLAQLEDFQKRLWLKKKFVVETNYCITLDRVPEELYAEIAANDAQREEWVQLFAIDKINGDMLAAGYSVPLTVEFLKAHDKLLVDTRHFDADFTRRLVASINDLDAQTDGLLIHSDNFQALRLLEHRYRQQVKCIYIDPPYNTSSSSIPYKNDYRHSSWVTMMHDRLALLRPVLTMDGAIFVSIDKTERNLLEHALDDVFGRDNRVEELIWAMNTNNSQAPNYSTNHEYVEVYARDRRTAEQDRYMFREPKPGFEDVMALVAGLNPSFPSVAEIEAELRKLYLHHKLEYREEVEAQGLNSEDEEGNDPWKGLFNYNRAEYRDASGSLVPQAEARDKDARIWVWREDNASMPAAKQAATTRDPNHPNWRFYNPPHPVTGRPCPHPKSGWKWAYDDDADSPDKRSFVSLDRDGRITWGPDEGKMPQLKRFLHEVETNVGKSVFRDYSDGEKQTSAMFGESGIFLAPKHADFVSRFIVHAAKADSTILDCFGGSGSTAHAVIQLNRSDRRRRKYVLVEVAQYFDTVLKPRVLKAAYSRDWRAGKPVSREGMSHCLKVIRLESYEDTLNNLTTHRTEEQAVLLDSHSQLREDYHLHYMLATETRGSPSLLDVNRFEDPFNYKLDVATGTVGETRAVNVDLVETFNYLLGLRVQSMTAPQGCRVVQGLDPAGNKVLVLWRNTKEKSNQELDAFFLEQGYNSPEKAFTLIYVNGDNNLGNLKGPNDTWKVRLIEEDFHRLMFDLPEGL